MDAGPGNAPGHRGYEPQVWSSKPACMNGDEVDGRSSSCERCRSEPVLVRAINKLRLASRSQNSTKKNRKDGSESAVRPLSHWSCGRRNNAMHHPWFKHGRRRPLWMRPVTLVVFWNSGGSALEAPHRHRLRRQRGLNRSFLCGRSARAG